MKVLLVYPVIDCPAGVSHGLASISAVLKSRGHETRLVHVNEHLWPIPPTTRSSRPWRAGGRGSSASR